MQHKAKNNKRVGLLYGDGYRPNVGIIIFNDEGKLLWARRVKHDGWQFPQGGVERGETVQEAVFRELEEEWDSAHAMCSWWEGRGTGSTTMFPPVC